MLTIEERRIALDKAITDIHVLAGDMGHDVHTPWQLNDDLSASTCCRRCGASAAARSYPDGRIWTGGKLTYAVECGEELKPAVIRKKRGR